MGAGYQLPATGDPLGRWTRRGRQQGAKSLGAQTRGEDRQQGIAGSRERAAGSCSPLAANID